MAVVFRRRKEQTPESAWRSAGMKWLKLRFGRRLWHYRTVGGVGQRAGVPDDLMLIGGVFVAIEWKRPDYRPTGRVTAQDTEIARIIECGGRAGKVRNWADLEALVEGLQPVQLGMKDRGMR